jgi:hypothetical protein
MIALFAALGGFVLGSLATFVLWLKSENRDLKQGYIEIAGKYYQLQPWEDPPLMSPGRRSHPHLWADRHRGSFRILDIDWEGAGRAASARSSRRPGQAPGT